MVEYSGCFAPHSRHIELRISNFPSPASGVETDVDSFKAALEFLSKFCFFIGLTARLTLALILLFNMQRLTGDLGTLLCRDTTWSPESRAKDSLPNAERFRRRENL
jgi:hypothetical protein